MYVRGPVWVAVHQLQKLPSRTIERHRIRRWLEAIEGIFALVVRHELPTQVAVYLLLILLFVKTCMGCQRSRAVSQDKVTVPFVDACQTSTAALANGFLVLASVTMPCMYVTWPSLGVSKVMVEPFLRRGAS